MNGAESFREGRHDEKYVRRLSGRERDCLLLIAQGLDNQMIADRLGISIGSVKRYVELVLMKYQSTGRIHAAIQGFERGDIPLDECIDPQVDLSQFKSLTPREKEVVESLFNEDTTNRAIADKLIISVPTVKTHFEAITEKTGIVGRAKIAVHYYAYSKKEATLTGE